LNSHGCGEPSYHWCVPGTPSYGKLVADRLPGLPAVVERSTTCPNQPLVCDA
jgi:hypothetical protein